jgi:hypothetical protein
MAHGYARAGLLYRAAKRLHRPATSKPSSRWRFLARRYAMNAIIYLVGLVVVVMFILSFLGLR